MSRVAAHEGWSRAELAESIGDPNTTRIDNWVRAGVLVPGPPQPASGAPRLFDHVDVVVARLVLAGRQIGMSREDLAVIGPAVREQAPRPDALVRVVLSRFSADRPPAVLVVVGERSSIADTVDDMTDGAKVVLAARAPRPGSPLVSP